MGLTKIKGKKQNMSQIFTAEGKVIPVTYIVVDQDLEEGLEGVAVTLRAKSKGKGFTGVMKKWNFAGQQATRGQSDKPRAAGSIGSQTPGRVYKGKKMAGRHGNVNVTVKGSKLIAIDNLNRTIAVKGPVPGARNTEVLVQFKNEVKNEG